MFVQLVFGDTTMGALTEITGVVCGESVSACLRHIFRGVPVALKEFDSSQVKLFLSDEEGIEASPPDYKGTALEPDETLRDEVLGRLNPTGAEAVVSFPNPLYLLAVVTGACVGAGWGRLGEVYGRSPFPPPLRRAGCRCGYWCECHITQNCLITQLTQLQVA